MERCKVTGEQGKADAILEADTTTLICFLKQERTDVTYGGAKGVAWCFFAGPAANMTRREQEQKLINISMNTPWA